MSPAIAWRVGEALDPAVFYSPKFPRAFAIVMPRKGEESTAVIVEDYIERVRGMKPKAA